MKKIASFCIDNNVSFGFTSVQVVPKEYSNAIRIAVINESLSDDLMKIISSEGLSFRVDNGYVIFPKATKKK